MENLHRLYRTVFCNNGDNCHRGEDCQFAHSELELLEKPSAAIKPSAAASTVSKAVIAPSSVAMVAITLPIAASTVVKDVLHTNVTPPPPSREG